MTARKRRLNVDETIENIQPPPPPSLNGIKLKNCYRITATDNTATTIYKCHYCPQQFLLKYNLVDHEFIHVLNQDKPLSSGRIINSVQMKVPGAAAATATATAAAASVKTFPCPHCPNTFSTRQNVTKHIRNQHSNSNPFECEQCDMTFGTKNHLDQHRYVHRVKGVWPCNLCKMQFHSESQLINHKRIHTWIVSLESHFPFNVNDSNVNFQSVQMDSAIAASNPNNTTTSGGTGKWSNAYHRTQAAAAASAATTTTAAAAVVTASTTCKDVPKKNVTEMVDIISISSDSLSHALPPTTMRTSSNAKNKSKTRPRCDECNQSFCDITKLRRHQLNHSAVRNYKCKRLKSHEKIHQNYDRKLI